MDHSQNIQDYVSVSLTVFSVKCVAPVSFLPRCIECRRSSRAKDVLSVRPSVKRVDCDKTEEKSVPIFIPTKNHLAYTLLRKKMVAGGGNPIYLKFGSIGPHWSEIADFEPILALSACHNT